MRTGEKPIRFSSLSGLDEKHGIGKGGKTGFLKLLQNTFVSVGLLGSA